MARLTHDNQQHEWNEELLSRPIVQQKRKSPVLFWSRTQELKGSNGELTTIILINENSIKLPSNISSPIILVQFLDHIRKSSLAVNKKKKNLITD